MNFGLVLRTVAAFLESRGYRFALIGGVALAAYGLARTTLDLELLVDARAQEDLIAYLESLGFEALHRSAGYSNHLHPDPAWGRLDCVYVRGSTSEEFFAGCRIAKVPGGLKLPLPKPEHLAALKVLAMKNDPTRTFQERWPTSPSSSACRKSIAKPCGPTSRSMASRSASMTSRKSSDTWDGQDLPTTDEDVQALRRLRRRSSADWLSDLTFLAAQVPPDEPALRRRRTFAGLPPFDL